MEHRNEIDNRYRPSGLVVAALVAIGLAATGESVAQSRSSGMSSSVQVTTPDGARISGTATSPPDREVVNAVVNALAADPALQGAKIEVAADEGHVKLTGTARSSTQVHRAREIAEGVVGSDRVSATLELHN